MKAKFEVGDKVQWNYGVFFGGPSTSHWRDAVVVEVDADDPGLPYKVRSGHNGTTYWCATACVRAMPEAPPAPAGIGCEPTVAEESPVIDPAWQEQQRRQLALAFAVDLAKTMDAGDEYVMDLAEKFEAFLKGQA